MIINDFTKNFAINTAIGIGSLYVVASTTNNELLGLTSWIALATLSGNALDKLEEALCPKQRPLKFKDSVSKPIIGFAAVALSQPANNRNRFSPAFTWIAMNGFLSYYQSLKTENQKANTEIPKEKPKTRDIATQTVELFTDKPRVTRQVALDLLRAARTDKDEV